MNIIQKQPNESGAYPPIQSFSGDVPDTHYEIAADTTEFFNGFIIPTIENNIVVSFVCNSELWEAWKAEEASKATQTPEPTVEEKLRADVDYIAMVTGVEI